MKRFTFGCVALLGLSTIVNAAAPGPLDGTDIPSDFGSGALLATQSNTTQFGNQTFTAGAYTGGSEADAIYLAQDPSFLYIGLTGNLETNGNPIIFFIEEVGFGFLGQTELRAECTGGPPYAVQNLSAARTINTNGTTDPSDDVVVGLNDLDTNGTVLPISANFALAIDTFDGTMSISNYALTDPVFGTVSAGSCTPDNPNDDATTDLAYAARTFVGQSPVSEDPPNDVLENLSGDAGPFATGGYGFQNINTAGVTDTDGSTAGTATTGVEVSFPRALLQNANATLRIYAVIADDNSGVSNQAFPTFAGDPILCPVGTNGMNAGERPDLSTSGFITVDLSTLAAFTGTAEGIIDPAEYGGSATDTQTCPTSFGDQVFDPDAVTPSNGSEVDALYVTDDGKTLYIGLTGNLEANGNTLHVFIDTDPDAVVDEGQSTLVDTSFVPGFNALNGLQDDVLPLTVADELIYYNFDYTVNVGGTSVFLDSWDLVNTNGGFVGESVLNSGDPTLTGGTNPNCVRLALNNLNGAGVVGCQPDDPCFEESIGIVEAAASTAFRGFEFAIPFTDLGIAENATGRIHVWTYVTGGGGGYGSNQALPSLRNMTSNGPNPNDTDGPQVENAANGPNVYTNPFSSEQNRKFDARGAEYTLSGGGVCPGVGQGAVCENCDINGSGSTTGTDTLIIINTANFGFCTGLDSCCQELPFAADACADVDGSGRVTGADFLDCINTGCFGL